MDDIYTGYYTTERQGGRMLKKQKSRNRAADPDADLESDTEHALQAADAIAAFDTPVRITFTHVRKKLADIDGISVKAAIDGLVAIGILADDSPAWVQEVRHRQTKGSVEETRIVIEAIE